MSHTCSDYISYRNTYVLHPESVKRWRINMMQQIGFTSISIYHGRVVADQLVAVI